MELDLHIEGLLFYKASPQKKSSLMKLFGVEESEFAAALDRVRGKLEHGATRLLETETEIQLVTAPELSDFIDTLRRDELSGDIGKAGAETLAIVLYKEPVSRAEIDRIRGVNSAFILRNLMTRGLIARESAGKSFVFRISPALLEQLGVTNKQELPEFGTIMDQLETFTATQV